MQSINSTTRRSQQAVILFFGLLPYVNTVRLPPLSQFWPEWACAGLAIAFICITGVKTSHQDNLASRLWVPFAALAAFLGATLLALQLLLRQPMFRGEANLAALLLVLAALVAFCGAAVAKRGQLEPVLQAFAVGLLAALLINTVQVALELTGHQLFLLKIVPRLLGDRVVGLLGQYNQLAAFSAMAWGASFFLWSRGRLAAKWILVTSAAVSLIGAASGSRAGLICWALSVGMAFWFCGSHPSGRQGRRMLIACVVVYVSIGFGYVQLDLNAAPPEINNSVLRTDTLGRVELLRDSWALIKLHPLLGVGFGNFSGARWEELSASMSEPTTTHAHNLLMQVLTEFGAVGAIAVLVPLSWAVVTCLLRGIRRAPSAADFFCAQIALVIATYSMTEYPLWYQYFLLPFAFVLGAAGPSLRLKVAWRPPVRLVGIFGIAAVSAWMLVAVDYVRLQTIYWDASAELATSSDFTIHLPRPAIRKISLLTAFDMWSELMLSRTLDLDPSFIDEKLVIARRAMRGVTNEETVARYIAFLVIAGRNNEALTTWNKTARGAVLREQTIPLLRIFASSNAAVAAFTNSILPVEKSDRP